MVRRQNQRLNQLQSKPRIIPIRRGIIQFIGQLGSKSLLLKLKDHPTHLLPGGIFCLGVEQGFPLRVLPSYKSDRSLTFRGLRGLFGYYLVYLTVGLVGKVYFQLVFGVFYF